MRSLNFIALIVLLVSAVSGCLGDNSRTAREELGIQALRVIDYADVIRAVIRRDCRRNPILAAQQPACRTIDSVPDSFIEAAALPHLLAYLTDEDLNAVLAFWDTPEGARISHMLVREISEDSPNLLSNSEIRALNVFNNSQAGRALIKLADDRNVSLEVIRAIGAYVP